MEDDIRHILAVLYFSLGLHFVEVITLLALVFLRDGKSIMGILPAVNDYTKRNFGYVTKIVRKKLKNMNGAPVVPDVSDEMMVRFVVVLLRELAQTEPSEIKLSESVWVRGGRWKQVTGGTPQQFRDAMARLEAARIVTRKDPEKREKSERILAMPYRSLESKLRKLLPQQTAKSRESASWAG